MIRFLFAAALLSAAEAAPARSNILLFLVDDLGVMDTSVPMLADDEGRPASHPLNEFHHTPNLENLAERGIRFEQFYANSVCSPSRVSLMTGQSSARHHTTQWINPTTNNAGRFGPADWAWKGIAEEQPTLAGLLDGAGYRTIHAGKAHFGPNGSHGELPQNFGFDVNIGGRAIGRPDSYYGRRNFGNGGGGIRGVPGLEEYHGEDIYLTEALTLEMEAAIGESVAADEPFFAYMSYYAVHSPFQPNEKYAALFEDAGVGSAAKAFATMVRSVDASVGELLGHVRELGVAEDTLVLFLGDNGTDAPLGKPHEVACSAPLRGKKGTHYEGGMRVPFIAAWAERNRTNPGQQRLPIAAGSLSLETGSILDIFPTLLNLAEVDFEGPVDGSDLSPLLAGGAADGEREFLMHFPHRHRSSYYTVYRKGDWKLIYHYRRPEGERCELFHLGRDPYESTNLTEDEPAARKRMIRAMAAALEDAGAQYVRAGEDSEDVIKPEVR